MGVGADRANPMPVNRSATITHNRPRRRGIRRYETGATANLPSPSVRILKRDSPTNPLRSRALRRSHQRQLHVARKVEDQLALHLSGPLQREVDAVEHCCGVERYRHDELLTGTKREERGC